MAAMNKGIFFSLDSLFALGVVISLVAAIYLVSFQGSSGYLDSADSMRIEIMDVRQLASMTNRDANDFDLYEYTNQNFDYQICEQYYFVEGDEVKRQRFCDGI